jgi:hypothetical protein
MQFGFFPDLPALGYSLAVGTLSEQQAHKIQGLVVRPLLQAMGFNACTPIAAVYAPPDLGGIGMRHLFSEQGTLKTDSCRQACGTVNDYHASVGPNQSGDLRTDFGQYLYSVTSIGKREVCVNSAKVLPTVGTRLASYSNSDRCTQTTQ